jgi:hypothetical protein
VTSAQFCFRFNEYVFELRLQNVLTAKAGFINLSVLTEVEEVESTSRHLIVLKSQSVVN